MPQPLGLERPKPGSRLLELARMTTRPVQALAEPGDFQ